MPPRQYRKTENCRPEIRDYRKYLKNNTDDESDDQLCSDSLDSYLQDIRWFDHWLDDQGYESASELSVSDSQGLAYDLKDQFNGSTPLNRYDRIHNFFDFLVRNRLVEENPLTMWKGELGLTKSTEQDRQMEDGEGYAVDQSEVRLMEDNVRRHATRDKLIIRLLWQTGMRRGELEGLTLEDIDRSRREVTIRKETSKSDYTRVVAYHPSLDGLLRQWIDKGDRDAMNRKDRDELLVGERGGKVRGERINKIVRNAAIDAGINRKLGYTDANGGTRWKITAHSLRHGYGTYMANKTDMGIWDLSKQMGHASVDTTERIYVQHDRRAGLGSAHRFVAE